MHCVTTHNGCFPLTKLFTLIGRWQNQDRTEPDRIGLTNSDQINNTRKRARKAINCCQFVVKLLSCLKKKTVAYTVNSLIDVNSSHRIFHNSASESVITSGEKAFRRVSINEESTTKERKAQNSTSPAFSMLSGDHLLLAGILLLIRSVFCQSDLIRSDPIRSDPVRSGPVQSGPVRSGPVRSGPVRSEFCQKPP